VLPLSEKRRSTSAAWGTMDKRVIASAFRGWSRFVIDFLAAIRIVGYEG
jgi:hypothetical protein